MGFGSFTSLVDPSIVQTANRLRGKSTQSSNITINRSTDNKLNTGTLTLPPNTNFTLDSLDNRGLYCLYITDLNGNPMGLPSGVSLYSGGIPGGKDTLGMALHEFYTAPQAIDISEEAAATIQPTLGNGIYTDEQGQATKLISISGTTGFRPNMHIKGAKLEGPADKFIGAVGGVAGSLGGNLVRNLTKNTLEALVPTGPLNIGPLSIADRDERGIAKGEITGFDEVTELKNLFRLYFDIKSGKHPKEHPPELRMMVWADIFTYEFWHVVPMGIQISRNAKMPFSFDYRIQLRTIKPMDKVILDRFKYSPVKKDTLFTLARQAISEARGVFLDSRAIIESVMNRWNSEVTSTTYQGQQAYKEVTDKTYYANINKFFGSIAVDGRIDSIPTVEGRAGGLPSSGGRLDSLPTPNGRLYTSRSSLEEASISSDSLKLAVSERDTSELFDTEFTGAINDIIRATNSLKSGLASISTEIGVDASDIDIIKSEFGLSRLSEETGAAIQTDGESSGVLDARNLQKPEAFSELIVSTGDTIYGLAERIFGNRLDYKILVVLNNLKWPYVADVPSAGVLGPGDSIKYPVEKDDALNNVVSKASDELNKHYGTDIAIEIIDSGYKLKLNNNGDFATISGKENLAQAMHIKHLTKIGELPVHPEFGFPIMPGKRHDAAFFAYLNVNLKGMYLSDARIESVKSLKSAAISDYLVVQAEVVAKGTGDVLIQELVV